MIVHNKKTENCSAYAGKKTDCDVTWESEGQNCLGGRRGYFLLEAPGEIPMSEGRELWTHQEGLVGNLETLAIPV